MKKKFLVWVMVFFLFGAFRSLAFGYISTDRIEVVKFKDQKGVEITQDSELYQTGNLFYFVGIHPGYGRELFSYNFENTQVNLVKDFNLGKGDSYIKFEKFNEDIYLVVALKSGNQQSEVWYENILYKLENNKLTEIKRFNHTYNRIDFIKINNNLLFLNVYQIDRATPTDKVTNNVYTINNTSLKFVIQGNIESITSKSGKFIITDDGKVFIRVFNYVDSKDTIVEYSENGNMVYTYPQLSSSLAGASYIYFDGKLYFDHNESSTGNELYRFSKQGPELVADINKGSASADIKLSVIYNNNLFFVANDGSTGDEMWRMDRNENVYQVADMTEGAGTNFGGAGCFGNQAVQGAIIFGDDLYIFARKYSQINVLFRLNNKFEIIQPIDFSKMYTTPRLSFLSRQSEDSFFFDIEDTNVLSGTKSRIKIDKQRNIEIRGQNKFSAEELTDPFWFGSYKFFEYLQTESCITRLLVEDERGIDQAMLAGNESYLFENIQNKKIFGNYMSYKIKGYGWVLLKQGDFLDVPITETFYKYIYGLKNRNITGGFGDLTYRPQNMITRGEFASLVVKSFGLKSLYSKNIFRDVDEHNTHFENIMTLSALNLINGFSDGTFRSDENITRGQASKIIANLLEEEKASLSINFIDINSDNKFYIPITELTNTKINGEPIVSGFSDGSFRPDVEITRGQAAKIVYLGSIAK